ncbi:transient receptor potential cation channel subfamily V member 2 isoform X1 [Tachyglossus aculeatus]|uniref:transient receptor potential cation channel subfamily V member 2 isoform X1 n=1 Tax=Tachyglossus aculeatus TaxID=9261 RepID=UPI0018F7511C|nr:transient receptor potential cation channel subfamily V member 2 isoform X1 [Tachyglossus aculeatus]XP_038614943.1 transient receptor potential cation channel subfamily V member 2 isoform X1 [Tachyglossus aculeatus]XP_038614945.1 transient receptor potential cation channel subfamily V member 2 isoform X1 [Tachyglossus aculeatus]
MPEPARPTVFMLETTDSDPEGRADTGARPEEKGGKNELPPMESAFQKENSDFPPQIRVNLNYRKASGSSSQPDPDRFDRDRLFGAVARGDPEELEGLKEYLERTSKYLTNSEFTEANTGKTCLMKALLNLKAGENATILPLLQIDKEMGNPFPLVNATCHDKNYRGHSALHIAIEKRSLTWVKVLVENGANVHAKADGQFFQKSKGICFYFGELPLSLAACTKQWDVVEFLLENPHQPARLEESDSQGNTVLHALVTIADNSKENSSLVSAMYDDILRAGARICPSVKLEDIPNNQGLTPLKLAAKEGKIEIFKHILQREMSGEYQHLSRRFTEWSYGPVQAALYDLSSVDSCEDNSVLDIIVFGCRAPNRHRMVVLEPLNKLLQEKWESLAVRFYFNFACYVIYMMVFTAVAYHQPVLGKSFLPLKATPGNSMLLLGHILILFGGFYLFFGQLRYFWKRHRFLWITFVDSYFEILILVQSLTTVGAQVLCFMKLEWYLPVLVFSLVVGWVNTLYYTRGFEPTGIYSVMIQKVILRDLLRFLLVYFVFLFGFAVALVSLTREAVPLPPLNTSLTPPDGGSDDDGKTTYSNMFTASLELFKFTIGMGELEFQEHLRFKGFVMFLLLVYVLLTYILLLNMLIALMSETVNSVSTDSKSIWKLQRAIAVLEMEMGYWWCRRKKKQSGTFLTVGVTPDQKKDERWCFRVEEVNWAMWERELQALKEDPGDCGDLMKNPTGKAWKRLLSTQRPKDSAPEEDQPLRP